MKVKNKLKSLTKKTTIFDEVSASDEDEYVLKLMEEAKKEFGDDVEKTSVTIKLILN